MSTPPPRPTPKPAAPDPMPAPEPTGNVPLAAIPPELGRGVQAVALGLSTALGAIRSARTGIAGVEHVSALGCTDYLGGLTIGTLAAIHRDPDHPARQPVAVECSQGCGTVLEGVPALLAGLTACDACREKAEKKAAEEKWSAYWEAKVPALYRLTDRNHVDFPRAQLNELRDWVGGQSLFFLGESGCGKTRLAYELLKRALWRSGTTFEVVRPQDLREAARSFEQKATLEKWTACRLLLLDDPFRDGVGERVVSFLVDLVDARMEHLRPFIVTSQLNGEDVRNHLDKYLERGDKASAVDIQRVEALFRRLREVCRVVPFARVGVPAGEGAEVF